MATGNSSENASIAQRIVRTAARSWGVPINAAIGAAVAGVIAFGPMHASASQASLAALSSVGATLTPVQAAASFYIQQSDRIGGDVGHIDVPTMSMTGSSLSQALDLALSDRGITVVVRSPLAQDAAQQTARGVKGSLEQVLNQLSQSLNFFWVAADGVVTIDGTRSFSLVIPAAFAADRSAVEKTLSAAGATDVTPVPLDNIVTFRASPSVLLGIQQTLNASAARRSLAPVAIAFGPRPHVEVQPPVQAQAQAQVLAQAQAQKLTQDQIGAMAPVPAANVAVAPMPVIAAPIVSPSLPQAAPVGPATQRQPIVNQAPATAAAMTPTPRVDSVAPAGAQAAPKFWGINVADRTVEGVLRRWARENGWDLRYEFDRIPVLRPASVIAADFLGAVKEVQLQLVEAGYDMDLAAIGSTLRVSPGGNK